MRGSGIFRGAIVGAAITSALFLAHGNADTSPLPEGACNIGPCSVEDYAAQIIRLNEDGTWRNDSVRWAYFGVLAQEGVADEVVGVLTYDYGCTVYEDLSFNDCDK